MIVIADDLTGANDTAIQFAKEGIAAIVVMDPSLPMDLRSQGEVCVINTETRSLPAEEAYRSMATFARSIQLQSIPFVYKKVDSTMRGNIGAEVDALMDHGQFAVAIVAPAYPRKGRITIGGYHLVHQVLLEDSGISRDPQSPVRESLLTAILNKQTKRKVAHLTIQAIRSEGFLEQIERLIKDGTEMITMDSASDEDLHTIACTLIASASRILWVGSAGLADALANQLAGGTPDTWRDSRQDKHRTGDAVAEQLPVLVVAGSVSEVTTQQVECLSAHSFPVIRLDPVMLLQEETREAIHLHKWDTWIEDAQSVLLSGSDLVITSEQSADKIKEVASVIAAMKLDPMEVGKRIAQAIGILACAVISKSPLSGIVLTGGDIAYQTCKELGVKHLQVIDEVEEGMPICSIGDDRDLLVITKAGAFGDRDSLLNAVNQIRKGYTKCGTLSLQ